MSATETLYTAQAGSAVLRIERNGRRDLPFTLDCNRLRNGSPSYLDLPRAYKTERGADHGRRPGVGRRDRARPRRLRITADYVRSALPGRCGLAI